MATDHDPIDPALRDAIATLEDREPATDLWPGISARLAPRGRTIALRWPMAAAAAVALVAGSVAVTRWMATDAAGPIAARPGAGTTPDAPSFAAGMGEAESALDAAIARLEAAVAEARPFLDARTQAGLDTALSSLDAALAEAAAAIDSMPNDYDAYRLRTALLQRKLRVLESVTATVS
jgi:hypothetical protein